MKYETIGTVYVNEKFGYLDNQYWEDYKNGLNMKGKLSWSKNYENGGLIRWLLSMQQKLIRGKKCHADVICPNTHTKMFIFNPLCVENMKNYTCLRLMKEIIVGRSEDQGNIPLINTLLMELQKLIIIHCKLLLIFFKKNMTVVNQVGRVIRLILWPFCVCVCVVVVKRIRQLLSKHGGHEMNALVVTKLGEELKEESA